MDVRPMSPEQRAAALKLIYRHTHCNYKGTYGSPPARGILMQRAGQGTCFVLMDKLTDAEIAARLPDAQRHEEARLLKLRTKSLAN